MTPTFKEGEVIRCCTLHAMEVAANKGRAKIRELESISERSARELDETKQKLQSTEKSAFALQKELDSKKKDLQIKNEVNRKLEKGEADRVEKAKLVVSLEKELSSYRNQISKLKGKLEKMHRTDAEEKLALRKEVKDLKEQQKVASSKIIAREVHIEEEVHALQEAMANKDSQIGSLETKLGAISDDLNDSRQELASKCEDVNKLTVEVEELRQQAQQSTPRHLLEVNHDEAESVDKMRSSIISLASALEQSEIRRAEAIERLEKERRANADSLHQMTESVKRFYSTLSCGDV